MHADEREWMESVSHDENTLDAERQTTGRRGYILVILIGALLVAELSKDVIFSTDRGDWHPAFHFLYYGLIAGLPFLLRRMAPRAAGFDTQWLPSSRWHWAWFLGMLLLLVVSKRLLAALWPAFEGRPSPRPLIGPVTPIGIVFLGIATVFIAPLAEEIFFRGYLLEQLRKLAHSGIAVLIQSLLFVLFHLYTRGLFTSVALYGSLHAFLLGMILGVWRIKFRSLLPLVLAHVLLNATVIVVPLKAQYDQVMARLYLTSHTISKETTYLTEPLRKDGSVDYVAALNRRFSKGVTPENNSAVLFWKAVGPREIEEMYREKYFRMLGMPAQPEKGDYFVDLGRYLAQREETARPRGAKPEPRTKQTAYDLLDPALKRPWPKEKFPVLAAWLAANERPLALLVEASKRPRRYDPLVCGEKTPLLAVLEPAISVFHGAGNVGSALVARAMLRLSGGKVDDSWEDLLTYHRLAQLIGQGPTEIDAMVAGSCQGAACAGDQAFLQHATLTTPQIARMREDLNRLPPMPTMAEKLDTAERFTYLNNVSDFSREGRASVVDLARLADNADLNGSKALKSTVQLLTRHSKGTAIDWDLILRMGNSWFDRIADAYRKPTRAAQKEAFRKLDEDFRKLKATAETTASLEKSMRGDRRKALSERLGQVILIMFSPSIALEGSVEDRAAMTFELTKLAFALAAYRADLGSYPMKLADLASKYVREVPKDLFSDTELHYRQEGGGYLLYSVGVNGKDDGGRSYDDRKHGEDWDDVVVRMPAAVKP
jgi:membrane protease YdiL (CAAX protease family)